MHQIVILVVVLLNVRLAVCAPVSDKTENANQLTASLKALKDIQATRNSPFFCMRGSWRKATGHGTPSSYKMVPNSRKFTFTVKSCYLLGNRATMVVQDSRKFDMINPQNETVKFEESIVEQEIWLKINNKWFLKFVKHLPGSYLVDGVANYEY